jgi:HPt (histidine-containing phosphotransfer) domain-containing protein
MNIVGNLRLRLDLDWKSELIAAIPIVAEQVAAALEKWTLSPRQPSLTEPRRPANVEPLDRSALDNLRKEGATPGLLKNAAELFLREARIGLERLKDAIRIEDAALVGRRVHTMKGSAGQLGALGMVAICADVEARAVAGDFSSTPTRVRQLDQRSGRVRPAWLAISMAA